MLMVDFRYWDVQTIGHEFTEMNDQVRKIVEDYDFGALIYRNGRPPHLNIKYRWGMNAMMNLIEKFWDSESIRYIGSFFY